MSGVDLEYRVAASVPELRGKLKPDALLKDFTWFRVGGSAQVLYSPADEADLAYFLHQTPSDVPITVIGLGSNLIVRDGGVDGVVDHRLGRGFGESSRSSEARDWARHRGARRQGRAGGGQEARHLRVSRSYRGIPGSSAARSV